MFRTVLILIFISTTTVCLDDEYEHDIEDLLAESHNPILRKEWESRNDKWIKIDSIQLRDTAKPSKIKNSEEWTVEDNHWEFDENKSGKQKGKASRKSQDSSDDDEIEKIVDEAIDEYDTEQDSKGGTRRNKYNQRNKGGQGEDRDRTWDQKDKSMSRKKGSVPKNRKKNNGGHERSKDRKQDKSMSSKKGSQEKYHKKDKDYSRSRGKKTIVKDENRKATITTSEAMPPHIIIVDIGEWSKSDNHWDLDAVENVDNGEEKESSDVNEGEIDEAIAEYDEETENQSADSDKFAEQSRKSSTSGDSNDSIPIEKESSFKMKNTTAPINKKKRRKNKSSKKKTGITISTNAPPNEVASRETEIRINPRNGRKTKVNINANKQMSLIDPTNRKIRVRIPTFKSSPISNDEDSFTFHMSHGRYNGIEKWVMAVVKLPQDSYGRPTFTTKLSEYNKSFKEYGNDTWYDYPFVVASFPSNKIPYKFTVGDGKRYGEFTNGKLESGQFYGVFMIGVVHLRGGKEVYIVTGWLEDSHSPGIPTYFKTETGTSVVFPILAIIGIITVFGGSVLWWCWRQSQLSSRMLRRNTSFNTRYKFGRLGQDDVIDNVDKSGKGKYKAKLPGLFKRPKKPRNNKSTGTKPVYVTSASSQVDTSDQDTQVASPSTHNLRRHFRDNEELEDTVVHMTRSMTEGGHNW